MIQRSFYDFALFVLWILFFPKLMIDYIFIGKYRKSLFSRIHPQSLDTQGKPVIWLHAVSVGEVKALSTLIPHIVKSYPEAFIFVTTVTETGFEQAKRSISEAYAIHYLPLDFSWIIRSFVRQIRPTLLVLVEGDYWYNLLREAKKLKSSIIVVNGKMSEKSLKRYLFLKSFSRSLFSHVDHFCLQGESYLERFLKLGISPKKLTITGNLKFDLVSPKTEMLSDLRDTLKLSPDDWVLTIGSTHEGEETLLLKELASLKTAFPKLRILLAPRHPERFARVKEIVARYPHVTLIDQIGVLAQCYRLSNLAIVGGSFIPGIGGHDIFEPINMGIPVLFGPFMDKQVDLAHLISDAEAGKMVSIEELLSTIEACISDPSQLEVMREKGGECAEKAKGSALRTWKQIESLKTLHLKS